MSDPGLTRRLRQQSHRSGLAIGLSMALAIGVLFGGFTWIYLQLDPWVRDFAGAEVAPPTPTPREQAGNPDDGEGEPADEDPADEQDEPAPTEEPEEQPNEDESEDEDSGNIDPVEEDEDEDGGFEGDYQVVTLDQVNMRSGPGRSFDIVISLDPGTPLESTGEREPAPDPEDSGLEWLEFETEDGASGWIRSIDVGET